MAMNVFRLLLLFCAGLVAGVAHAQPQWRFHLAFEDATGARDTIWYIWDETATTGSWSFQDVDYHLGEGRVDMDLNSFNVWLGNWDGDSTKTVAIPYTSFPWHSAEPISAFNYTYPITIRWDRSLFSADFLPDPNAINFAVLDGLYCFAHGNFPPEVDQLCDVLGHDSLVVDLNAQWATFFPTTFLVGHENDPLLVVDQEVETMRWWVDGEQLFIAADAPALKEVVLYDLSGREVYRSAPETAHGMAQIALGHWTTGVCILRIRTTSNTYHHGKFSKMVP